MEKVHVLHNQIEFFPNVGNVQISLSLLWQEKPFVVIVFRMPSECLHP